MEQDPHVLKVLPLLNAIARQVHKQSVAAVEDRGLSWKDHAMFERALSGYAKTEREIANVRVAMLQGKEIPDEYQDKRRSLQASAKSKRNRLPTPTATSNLFDSLRESIHALRPEGTD